MIEAFSSFFVYIENYWIYLICIYLITINVIVFIAYGIDKHAAIRHRRRIPENILHLFALIGGTPLAFIAQRLFHHKTKKKKFQVIFWSIAAMQIFVFVLLLRNKLA